MWPTAIRARVRGGDRCLFRTTNVAAAIFGNHAHLPAGRAFRTRRRVERRWRSNVVGEKQLPPVKVGNVREPTIRADVGRFSPIVRSARYVKYRTTTTALSRGRRHGPFDGPRRRRRCRRAQGVFIRSDSIRRRSSDIVPPYSGRTLTDTAADCNCPVPRAPVRPRYYLPPRFIRRRDNITRARARAR